MWRSYNSDILIIQNTITVIQVYHCYWTTTQYNTIQHNTIEGLYFFLFFFRYNIFYNNKTLLLQHNTTQYSTTWKQMTNTKHYSILFFRYDIFYDTFLTTQYNTIQHNMKRNDWRTIFFIFFSTLFLQHNTTHYSTTWKEMTERLFLERPGFGVGLEALRIFIACSIASSFFFYILI